MPAGRLIGIAPNHHELSRRGDIAAGACLEPPQVLQKRQENEPARQNEAFGKASQFLMRRQRQKVEIAQCGGPNGARKRGRRQRHIGIHEAKPLRRAEDRARSTPAGMRFSQPACRQRRATQQFNLSIGGPQCRRRRRRLRLANDRQQRERATGPADSLARPKTPNIGRYFLPRRAPER